MSDRGEYRSFYVSFWDDPDVHALSDRAYRVLSTLRGTLGPTGIGIVYTAQLCERCRATPKQIEAALVELETPKPGQSLGWIVRERNIIWIVNALRFEPNLYVTNEKHRTYVAKLLLPFGERTEIVSKFRRYYSDWFGIPEAEGNEGVSATPSHRVSEDSDTLSKHRDVDRYRDSTETETKDPSSARETPLHDRLASDADRTALDQLLGAVRDETARIGWIASLTASLDGMPGHAYTTPAELGLALRDYVANGALKAPNAAQFRGYLTRAKSAANSPATNGAAPHRGIGARVAARTRAAIEDL